MIRNYVKIAWRNIIKRRFYSMVNIAGLAVGIAFTLLTAAYVWGQLQINHQLKNADNQYILQSKWKDPNMGYEICTIADLPKALKDNYPNLVAGYYHDDGVTSTISKGDKHFREGIQIGDSTMLEMYGFQLLCGNAKTALDKPYSVVISADKALKYFNRTDVLGQTITIESFNGTKHDFLITGVMGRYTKNSVTDLNDFHNDFFLPFSAATYMGRYTTGWNNVSLVGYIELQPGVTPQMLEKPMRQLIKSNASAQTYQNLTPYLTPLKTYSLSANKGVVGKMLYTLGTIAFFILMMAVINFINLCISQYGNRMREIGIRKVVGGLKSQIIWQFLTESVLLVTVATIAALLICVLAKPYFSSTVGENLPALADYPVYFIAIPFILTIIIGLAAGVYPAFVLSSLKSIDSLKGKLGSVKDHALMRKSLVVFQFGVAAVVFTSAIIISQQVRLFFSRNLGYDKDYVVYAQVSRDWSARGVQHMESVAYRLAQMPVVSSVSLSWEIPDGQGGGSVQLFRQSSDSTTSITATGIMADNQYGTTYHIPLKAGRFFAAYYSNSQANAVVVNEAETKAMGWANPADAIGQQVRIQGNPIVYTIAGVTSDFHIGSMQQRIQPAIFFNVNDTHFYRYLSIRIKPGNVTTTLAALEQNWAKLLPGAPFEYSFMDDALKKLYKTEIQLKQASYIATALAIVIAFLGVLGLVSLNIQKRTREIGIRKVLGSSVAGIIALFMHEFLMIVLVAGLIAGPVAYWLMQKWLNDYVYRISITFNPFVLSITALAVLTALLIGFQSVIAALANPVKSLRNE